MSFLTGSESYVQTTVYHDKQGVLTSFDLTGRIVSLSETGPENNHYVMIVDRKRTNQSNLRIFCHSPFTRKDITKKSSENEAVANSDLEAIVVEQVNASSIMLECDCKS